MPSYTSAFFSMILLALLTMPLAMAHEPTQKDSIGALGESKTNGNDLVIVRELNGPTKTHGIESVKALGVVDLGA